MTRPSVAVAAALTALLVLGAACGDSPTQPDRAVAEVEIAAPGTSVQVHQTLQLSAVTKAASGDVLSGRLISWSSGNEALATVSAAGVVTGLAEGIVWITAASEGRTGAVQIEVTPAPVPPPPPPPPPPPHPVPAVASISPSLIVAGTNGLTVTVTGTNFIAASVGMWKGSSRPTDVVSAAEIRIHLSAEDLAAEGKGAIKVFNPTPGGGMSGGVDLTIETRGPKVRLDLDAAELIAGDTIRVRATVYDAAGTPVPGTSDPAQRLQWIRLDNGTEIYYYDAIRDSMRVRVRGVGTYKIVARTPDGFTDTLTLVSQPMDERLVSIDAGGHLNCGLDADARAYCWGHTYPSHSTYAPVAVPGGRQFDVLATGQSHACALDRLGTAYCWGENTEGSLGNGGSGSQAEPLPVVGAPAFVSIVAGGWHTCGLTLAGKAWCWGANLYGQLGNDAQQFSNVAVPVTGDFVFTSISTGAYHTCAVTPEGEIYCWGYNAFGQAGLDRGACIDEVYGGQVPCNLTPAVVETELRFVAVAVGGFHTCAVTDAGAAFCWGAGERGQLGDGAKTTSAAPVAVAGGRTLTSLGAGIAHTCGLTAAGKAWCWGQNDYGTNGVHPATSDVCVEGTTGYLCNATPVAVSGGLTFAPRQLSVAMYSTCGVTTAGLAYCWGANSAGELGAGSELPNYTGLPLRVRDGS
jgi:alpha-tubulin suppressor-like RCC1 family protein